MEMEALALASAPNKYRYNGKELNEDFGLNWSDYGARWYDAAVGRWWSVDPMAEQYVGWSPYNYGVDNPTRFVDPDGMAVNDYIFLNSRGEEIHRIKDDKIRQITIINDNKISAFNIEKQGQYAKPTENYLTSLQGFGITYDINSIELLEQKSLENGKEIDQSITLSNGEYYSGNVEYSAPLSEKPNGESLTLFIEIDKVTKGVNRSSPAHKSLNINDAHYHPGPYVTNASMTGNPTTKGLVSVGGDKTLPPSDLDMKNQERIKFYENKGTNGVCISCKRLDIVITPNHLHFYQTNMSQNFSINRKKL